MSKNNTTIFSCDKIRYFPINKYNCANDSSCLVIPLTLHCVCSNSHILVIVELFLNNKLYSRKIKKIFTGKEDSCNCPPKSDCCNSDNLIDSLFVDNFKFYFLNTYDPKSVTVEVNLQYIYDC